MGVLRVLSARRAAVGVWRAGCCLGMLVALPGRRDQGREVFRASHLSGLPGLSYLVLVDIQGISMDDKTYWMST